jgi:hypothetical protein
MKVIYLSGKIDNTEECFNAFSNAEEFIKTMKGNKDARVINLTKIYEVLPELSPYQFRQIAFQFIQISDTIFMIDGWQKSKQSCAELSYAKSIGKNVLYQKYYKEYRYDRKIL